MICVGIDIAKDKHDCCILDSDGTVRADCFTIPNNCYAHMEKRGSRYLRYALYNATKYVCHWNPVFAEYLAKKRAEGKHYNVALSHSMKKLVRLIYALQKSGKTYLAAA